MRRGKSRKSIKKKMLPEFILKEANECWERTSKIETNQLGELKGKNPKFWGVRVDRVRGKLFMDKVKAEIEKSKKTGKITPSFAELMDWQFINLVSQIGNLTKEQKNSQKGRELILRKEKIDDFMLAHKKEMIKGLEKINKMKERYNKGIILKSGPL